MQTSISYRVRQIPRPVFPDGVISFEGAMFSDGKVDFSDVGDWATGANDCH
ncbi:MAG TPA: hypothetical protein VMT24_01875 [Aggregatilineaceae bacterium]|nr:hypothetical protein [Aggregatilineaceae bacterium]